MKHTENKDEWNQLVKLLFEAESEEMMDQMLHLFLTINEREFLLDRYKIVKALLTSSLPQRKLAEELGVSIAKITVGSNELKRTAVELIEYVKNHVREIEIDKT